MSHPVWVRGLKQAMPQYQGNGLQVAPRVGAWIETIPALGFAKNTAVAPRVGAWIETSIFFFSQISMLESHPVWVRGLKQNVRLGQCLKLESHPVWVRGLKLVTGDVITKEVCRTPCGCVD